MPPYLTHDLTVEVGDEAPEDNSLNMLQFHARQTTLVIARSAYSQQQTLDQAFDEQFKVLSSRLGVLTSSGPATVLLGPDAQLEGREIDLEYMLNDAPTYQLQVACKLPGQPRLLVLSYSKHSPFSEDDIDHWRSIKKTLRLA